MTDDGCAALPLFGCGSSPAQRPVVSSFLAPPPIGEVELLQRFESLDRAQEREERMLREEMSRSREEKAAAAKAQRGELTSRSKACARWSICA